MAVVFTMNPKHVFRPRPTGRPCLMDDYAVKGDNGCTVMLIHGLTGSPVEMRFLAGYLNKRGYSVVCPRLANHGEPIGILKYTRWQEFYESVRQAFLREQASCDGSIFAAGLSMGALLALLLADEFKTKIAGASCLAPTLFYDGWNTPNSRFLLPLGYMTPLKYFFYFKEDPPYGIKNEAIQQRIHRYYEKANLDDIGNVGQYGYPYFPVTLLYQLRLLVGHLTKRLPQMSFPVQLIQAKDDDMTSTRNSKFIYDRIGSEMKEIVLLYDSYHVVTADQEREIVGQKMEKFFQRVREKAGPLREGQREVAHA